MKKLFYTTIFLYSLLFTNEVFSQIGNKTEIQNVSLQNLEGGIVNFSLNQYQNKECIVLIFTSTGCAYDQAFQIGIDDALSQFEQASVEFIFINPRQENIEEQKAHAAHFNRTYLLDKNKELANLLNIQKTPEVRVFQNNGGNFILKYQGLIDDSASGGKNNYLILAVESTINKQPCKTPIKDPVGCSTL